MSVDEETVLVSLLCRSMNRPELTTALGSALQQSWSNLEILVVDATGEGRINQEQLPDDSRIRLLTPDTAMSRPKAANHALDQARGDYLIFLDEDDWIDSSHISTLVDTLVRAPGSAFVAYSATAVVTESGEATESGFHQAFDRALLMHDNYVPIHSAVFSRTMLDEGCRFDESLPIYEDWDFWLQCAQFGDFVFVPAVSAHYRQGGGSQTALTDQRSKFDHTTDAGKARARLFEKWRTHWSGADINAMLGSVDKSTELRELARHVQSLEAHIRDLEREHREKSDSINRLSGQLDVLNTELAHARSEIALIVNSYSWRLTRPLRWLKCQYQSRFTTSRPQNNSDS